MKLLNETFSRAVTVATFALSGFFTLQLYNPSYRGLYCVSKVKRL